VVFDAVQLKELVVLMDGQLGLPPGWLMAVQTTVFVYVCASTRGVLGAVFMERITQALTASTSAAESPGEVGAGAEEAVRRRDPTSSSIVVADKSSEVRAHCGVRMMWTSPNARRKGVATKLLDCARSQLAHGYVVPRAEVAFSQPTCDGAAFIQAYTGSSSFRVYGATL